MRCSYSIALAGVLVACGDSGSTSASGTSSGSTAGTGSSSSGGMTASTTAGVPTSGSGGMSDSSSGSSTMNVDPTTSASGSSSGSTTGGTKFDVATEKDFEPGECGCGNTDFSYIWIANSPDSTVSKIMTLKVANSCEYGRIQGVA